MLLRTLAHEDRLLLLCQLCEQEMCVSDLEESLDIRQPSLSQQLGVLRREGLVHTRREGKHIYYSVKPGPALVLLQTLHNLFCDSIHASHGADQPAASLHTRSSTKDVSFKQGEH